MGLQVDNTRICALTCGRRRTCMNACCLLGVLVSGTHTNLVLDTTAGAAQQPCRALRLLLHHAHTS
jgi:hypothetical protein